MSILFILEATLSQVDDMLENIEEAAYQQPLEIFSNSSIGQHTRHIIEFLQCLIGQSAAGVVNYDQRPRNAAVEVSPMQARKAIAAIKDQLPQCELGQSLLLESDYGLGKAMIHRTFTTLERELVYNVEHAIHHMAIIKIGIRQLLPDFELPEGFGVAPSTIRYRKQHN